MVLNQQGDRSAADEQFRQAIALRLQSAVKLLQRLVADFPEAPLFRQRLAAALQELASQFIATPESFRQAIAIQTQLAADFPMRADLATTYTVFAASFKGTGCREPARPGRAA